jgi:hypothetical protein
MVALPGSFGSFLVPAYGYPVTEKLTKNNFQLWRAQVMSALRGLQVAHFITTDASVSPKTVHVSKEKPTDKVPKSQS